MRLGLSDEIDLVCDQQHRHLVVLGHDQEPIDEARVRRRTVTREHDDHEVGIRDDHVLAPRSAWTGLAAAEAMLARLDGVDGARSVGQSIEADAITDDRQVRRLALLLHAAAQPRLDEVAVVSRHGVEARTRAKDEAARLAHPRAPTRLA